MDNQNQKEFPLKRIGVMCGSSESCDSSYHELAKSVGHDLALHKMNIIYGGGAKGLMRHVADAALSKGVHVKGVIPQFMKEVEWHHPHLDELVITHTMAERKNIMLTESDATLFLPGGSGTMEEFFEWMSAKRLGFYQGPLIIYNYHHFYDPLIELLSRMHKEKFLSEFHKDLYQVVKNNQELIELLRNPPSWHKDAITRASL